MQFVSPEKRRIRTQCVIFKINLAEKTKVFVKVIKYPILHSWTRQVTWWRFTARKDVLGAVCIFCERSCEREVSVVSSLSLRGS